MKKLTAQIAAMYLGQKMVAENEEFDRSEPFEITIKTVELMQQRYGSGDSGIVWKPILRRLDSLTESEARELYEIRYPTEKFEEAGIKSALYNWWNQNDEWYVKSKYVLVGTPGTWLKLLSWGFDLFGLIDAGLAIDAETLKIETV